MYTVTINGRATFPADYPPPVASAISSAISTSLTSISVYVSESQPLRVDRTFSVTVKGSVVASLKDEIESGLATAWISLTTGKIINEH